MYLKSFIGVLLVLLAPTVLLGRDLRPSEGMMKVGPAPAAGEPGRQVSLEAGQADGQGLIVITVGKDLTLKVSAPVDKSSGLATFTSLDGLANNLALTGVLKMQLSTRMAKAAWCNDNSERTKLYNATGETENRSSCQADKQYDGYLKAVDKMPWNPEETQRELMEMDKVLFGDAWTWGLLAEGKAGYKQFEFFDAQAKKQSKDKISTSVSLSLMAVRKGSQRVLFSATYQQANSDGKISARSCSPVAGASGLETCKELPFGPPTRKDGLVLRTELRQHIGKWGLAPTLSWDADARVYGAQLPVYFLPGKAGALTGGLRLGWRSDVSGVTASVFVSKPLDFDLFSQ